jgi:hypothetical protein
VDWRKRSVRLLEVAHKFGGEETKEFSRRMGTMHAQRSFGGFRERMGNSQPGGIFAQEQDLENRVVHRSFLLLLAKWCEHVHG